ncbi:hypothetical protein [Pseudarthrobacter chlorophenolicus]|nr:hypothetical protein [Pseudarthrobacter chlorophenolicus]SDQ15969.1 hypothetical protein SAMN04489738_0392 [Pseudarthrobacter chlorophenolicus]
MSTEAATQPILPSIPETEPPIGTVASFHYRFASGGGTSTGIMLHTAAGWTSSAGNIPYDTFSWAYLTDIEAMNAATQQRTPGSTAVRTALEVRIHATPPQDHVGDRARLVKLQHAVYGAAERLGIQTEGASHTELVTAIENLAFIARRA